MTTYYKVKIRQQQPICRPFVGEGPHLTLTLQADSGTSSYNAYWQDETGGLHGVEEIEVNYSGGPTPPTIDFVMVGNAATGSPTIGSVRVEANYAAWCEWSTSGTQVKWTFFDPPSVSGAEAVWEFNPSGNGPPVKVKVVLKRHSGILTTCP